MPVSEKIKTVEEVAKLIEGYKTNNIKVVHAHGCFDLLHYGHIRFLQQGKELGPILVVSLTSDEFINKGPGRPLFDNGQRAYQLASLECVDLVCVNYEADACNLIETIKPDIAIRGSEYSDSKSDITGKIDEERLCVESVGGEMLFIDTPVYSSTQLVSAGMSHLPAEIASYKEELKEHNVEGSIDKFFSLVKKTKLLLVGDLIIDEYVFANVLGTVSKHSAVSASFKTNNVMGGGALAIAKHMANFVEKVTYITRIGNKSHYDNDRVLRKINENIQLELINEKDSYSVVKTRYIASGYSNPLSGKFKDNTQNTDNRLFEISHMPAAIDDDSEKQLMSLLDTNLSKTDLLIVSDFGHGLLSEKTINYMCGLDHFIALNVQTNSSNFGFNLITKYSRADFICIDEIEARLALGERGNDIDYVAAKILTLIDCKHLMITRGKQGLIYYSGGTRTYAPALATNVVDAVGAGDAVFSGAAICAYHGLDVKATALIASTMGMIGTKIVGNERSIEMYEVIGNIKGFMKYGSL